jgi:uncharacterized membrane protein
MKYLDTLASMRVWKQAKRISHWDFHPAVRSGDDRTLGEKAADAMRHGMGTWTFIIAMFLTMLSWAYYNSHVSKPFDPFPFILMNLMLSGLAGLQGAILLVAAKRADRISSELAKYHLEVSEHANEELADLKQLIRDMAHVMTELDSIKEKP